MNRICVAWSLIVLLSGISPLIAAETARLDLSSPLPHQVVQREGFQSSRSHDHNLGGPELGYADIEVQGTLPADVKGELEFRVVALKGAFGTDSNWAPLVTESEGQTFRGPAEMVAGGWYRLEVRCIRDGKTVAEGAVEPVGVGEVFLIAGQSYAAGANDELLKVTDPERRVSAYDWVAKTWSVANDPQPHVGDGGTIWPHLGDLLVPTLRVPVAFVNVAVGGTSSRQWLPDEELHRRLVKAGRDIGSFRAVLWQQGESDVIEHTPTETYIGNMIKIREAAARAWRFEPPWLLAKSTLHPTVYNDPVAEERIRSAIHQLWKRPHFGPGPDTDQLAGENRGDVNSRRHFSGIGQRRAALLWYVAVWNEIHKGNP
ncbi:sialate O-acetylesterase [Schlesneria sp.]|uniref:sialate O-acetylesterase n=1 Tax=Schlesneria sp. TaxID=2762018 RepID=UPI002EF62E02